MKAVLRAAATGLLVCMVSGCVAPPIMMALSENDMATFGLTGKSFEARGLDAATGENCSISAAAFESQRQLCMPNGAPATQHDFKGLIGMAKDEKAHPPLITRADAHRTDHLAQ